MSESITRIIVQATFGLLLLASVATWAVVLIKARQRWRIKVQDRAFFRAAGKSLRLATLRGLRGHAGPAWRVTQVGLHALADAEAERDGAESSRDAVERALQTQIIDERRSSEAGLAVLASIGSTAPFVGLFGTVWGIIEALRAIGHSGSASLEVVAGPIGEALVATGVGIAVAVPAVLAFNFSVRRVKLQVSDLEQFGAALLGAIARGSRADVSPLRVERANGHDVRHEASV
jgi:biopolymer transport protein ExbB